MRSNSLSFRFKTYESPPHLPDSQSPHSAVDYPPSYIISAQPIASQHVDWRLCDLHSRRQILPRSVVSNLLALRWLSYFARQSRNHRPSPLYSLNHLLLVLHVVPIYHPHLLTFRYFYLSDPIELKLKLPRSGGHVEHVEGAAGLAGRTRSRSCPRASALFLPMYLRPRTHPPSRLPLPNLRYTPRDLLSVLRRVSYGSRTGRAVSETPVQMRLSDQCVVPPVWFAQAI
jgi:hypothetical protein